MPSLDFNAERNDFRGYYDANARRFEGAIGSFTTLIRSLLADGDYAFAVTTGRVKEREESIKKFQRKYQSSLENDETPYVIQDHITDLIGLRLVCLYEDEIEPIAALVREQFETLGVTDKIAQVEGTEDAFGYKGLHLDLKLDAKRADMPEYAPFAALRFELQIRTIIQDSWSALDHKIKYKKSIPPTLKRRINTLAALFELADREFRAVREATRAEYEKAEQEDLASADSGEGGVAEPGVLDGSGHPPLLDAFRFLRIAQHFFSNFVFEPHKVDGFTAEIVRYEPAITASRFNFYMRENIALVKRYRTHLMQNEDHPGFNAYTAMRLCLYAGDETRFAGMLTNRIRKSFDAWTAENGNRDAPV